MSTVKNNRKGFTLIELLVVITIIGILATGAISVYTSQIQKARDTTRINDIEALKSGVEQFYQDKQEYPCAGDPSLCTPANAFTGIIIYTPKIPTDPKTTQKWKSFFDYAYSVWPDTNTILAQTYELSTGFENDGNITSKANVDGWNNLNRLEVWISTSTRDTWSWAVGVSSNGCVLMVGPTVGTDKPIAIIGKDCK